MQELRFVAVSEDGSYAVLAIPGRSGRFMLPIDDRLRAVAKGQFSRLAQYEIEVENPLRPKEIQARIRAGETVEEIADAAGIPVERVRWFEGPVLAERGYVAEQAQSASVRRQGDSTPGPRLGEVVAERLTELGADPEDAQWDSRKHGDGSWQVQLAFRAGGRLHIAEWLFDPRRRHVSPADDNAERLSLPEAELPAPTTGSLGAATVTPIRPRPDRSQAPAVPDPAEATFEQPARAAAHAASPVSFAPSRPPVGRPPSHAAPQPGGGSRTASDDDQPNGTGPVSTEDRTAAGRDAGNPGPGGHGSEERGSGGYRTGSPEPSDRDHTDDGEGTAGSREDSGTEGRYQADSPAVAEAAAEHQAAAGPATQDASTRDPAPRDPDAARPAGQPAAAAPTRPGDAPAAQAPAGQAPAAQTPAASASTAPAAQAPTAQAASASTAQAPAGPAPAPQAPAPTAGTSADGAPASGRGPASAPSPAQAPAEKRADETPPRGRGKKAAGPRGRRSSVPSWDEIMLGNSRQPD